MVIIFLAAITLPLGAADNLMPVNLMPSMGPVIAAPATQDPAVSLYDKQYKATEQPRWQQYLADEGVNGIGGMVANHYGGLRSRLMWGIRHGEPFGAGVIDENLYGYARGKRIVLFYLNAYSQPNNYGTPPHNNTGVDDIEALFLLEGTPVAREHIQCNANGFTGSNWDGWFKMQNPGSDPRIIAIALQLFSSAHRLQLPYARGYCPNLSQSPPDPKYASFKDRGNVVIQWLDTFGVVQPNGRIISNGHTNNPPTGVKEAYLFNAMVATQLLRWSAFVDKSPLAEALAKRIVDHLIDEAALKPGGVLSYLSFGWPNEMNPSGELAGFYVWPALALWQDTGDQKYFDFALTHLEATYDQSISYVGSYKQWNQVYSTGAQGAEAMMNNVSWRTGGAVPPPPPPSALAGAGSIPLRVYPNPWRSDRHNQSPYITFDQIGAQAEITLFNTAGHLVKKLSTPTGSVQWNLDNQSGDKVASGIYLYHCKDGQGRTRKGKVAIIR